MRYQIAVATSDGVNINQHFGHTESFWIYRVEENDSYELIEVRIVKGENQVIREERKEECGGCLGHRKYSKIEAISDCRCVLCSRCGYGTEKELYKAGITAFVIEKEIDEALQKIIRYYRNDKSHVSLRSSYSS